MEKKKDTYNDPFLEAIRLYSQNRHYGEVIIQDEVDGYWALLFQKQEEISLPFCEFPEDTLPKDEELKSWIDSCKPESKAKPFLLEENTEDINVGKAPEEWPRWLDKLADKGETFEDPSKIKILGYVPMFHELGKKLKLGRYFYDHHFGGTSHPRKVNQKKVLGILNLTRNLEILI